MLIKINIIKSKKIDTLIFRFIALISNYKMKIIIKLKFKK